MDDVQALPDFEIDHPETHAQFLIGNPLEIQFYLHLLSKRHCLFTAYIDNGRQFFLTSIVGLDENTGTLFLDPSNARESNANAHSARQITLVTNLDRVKIQIRLPALRETMHQGQAVLSAAMPKQLLRLQRREFFRLEPPLATPIVCQLAGVDGHGRPQTFELQLSDISGGGVSLIGPLAIAEHFPRDALFQHCRLDIPDEGVIQVNLRVRKTIEISGRDGQHNLRIG
ncbi:MAG: flagellar brake protein, partial [Dechloromonas sp.]